MQGALVHSFTKRDIRKAEHLFKEAIEGEFGEVWKISIDGRYRGLDVLVKDPRSLPAALWHLVKTAKGRGAIRAAGRIETQDQGDTLRLVLFYEAAGIVKPGELN